MRDTNPGPGGSSQSGSPFVIEKGTSVPISGNVDYPADNDYVWILDDDDHSKEWTQINPVPEGQVCRTVWAVVDDEVGLDNIMQVIYQQQYPDVKPYCGCSKPKFLFISSMPT